MELNDYSFPDDDRRPRTRRAQPGPQASVSGRQIALLIGIALLVIVAMAGVTYQLAHPPRALVGYVTTPSPSVTADVSPTAAASPTPNAQHPTADPRYDRQLASGVLGGFGKQPRDLDIGGRRFTVLGCDGWDCQIELDDGAQVWVTTTQAGELDPTPTPVYIPPPQPTICATARGQNGEATLCGYGYDALLQQAQQQAGPPIAQAPVATPEVDAYATQNALGNQTAYAVQTAQAHIIQTQIALTPIGGK